MDVHVPSKRPHQNDGDDVLPPAKRLCAGDSPLELMDLPTEVLSEIFSHCDKKTTNQLACVSTTLHRMVTWNRSVEAVMVLPNAYSSLLANLALMHIKPFAALLRARPWWKPPEFRVTVRYMVNSSTTERNTNLPLCVQYIGGYKSLREDLALIAERTPTRCLVLDRTGSNSVITYLSQVLRTFTHVWMNTVAHDTRQGFFHESYCARLNHEAATTLALCETVTLSGLDEIPQDALNGFCACRRLVLEDGARLSDSEVEFLERDGVHVVKNG